MGILLKSDAAESDRASKITQEELKRIEKKIGKVIPAAYKEVLLQQNDGSL